MSGYKAVIMQATGCSAEVAPVLEGIMRSENGGVLDSLKKREFNRQARDAFRTYAELRDDPEAVSYFRKQGL